MDRRRFDHLFIELCVACGQPISRFRLWLFMQGNGAAPDQLSRDDAIGFCRYGAPLFLAEEGLHITRWQRFRLLRRIAAFEPDLSPRNDGFEQFDPNEDL